MLSTQPALLPAGLAAADQSTVLWNDQRPTPLPLPVPHLLVSPEALLPKQPFHTILTNKVCCKFRASQYQHAVRLQRHISQGPVMQFPQQTAPSLSH